MFPALKPSGALSLLYRRQNGQTSSVPGDEKGSHGAPASDRCGGVAGEGGCALPLPLLRLTYSLATVGEDIVLMNHGFIRTKAFLGPILLIYVVSYHHYFSKNF